MVKLYDMTYMKYKSDLRIVFVDEIDYKCNLNICPVKKCTKKY